MNYKNVLIGVFAILAGVLILDLPIIGAVQVNIYYDVGGGNKIKQYGVTIEPENLIDKSISIKNIGGPSWTNAKIIINISNGGTSDLESVHVYKCKGLSPTDCVETETPDMHTIINNDLDLELLWNDISHVMTSCSSSPSSCLEVANLFFLFKVNDNGKTVWVGIWNKIERRTYNFAAPYLFEYSLDEIDLDAEYGFATHVRDFIQTYLTIPFNPVWVSGAIFQGADALYELSVSSSELQQSSPNFYTEYHATNEMDDITRDYSFVLPNTSQGIVNSITLRLNPSFLCGNDICETDKGESSSNCCYDCPCSEGYYCDGGIEGICKLESLISLSLYETPNTTITNCNEEHVINVTAEVNYAPSDMDLTRSEYKLNDTTYSTQCNEIFSDIYRCPVTVPPMPDCQEGEYRISPNYLNFTISYTNGSDPKTKDLVVQFPDIIVASFGCGENGCESELGENSDNCCYDCGCPGGYCDIADGADPNTGICKQDIGLWDLQITADPTHFYTHNNISGDRVDLLLQISNAPLSLNIVESSCEMDCYYDCSASCDVSCSEISSSDPNVFNASCLLTFIISDYNKTIDYSMIPTLNMSVTYKNGSLGDISKNFSSVFSTISVGSSWCGDDICTPDENQLTCCYDCGCPGGYYCDTANAGAPTAGDSCRSEEGIILVVDGVEVSVFDYSDRSHYTILMAHVENAPSSLTGSTSCMFGDGSSIYCNMDCERFGADPSSHILQCNLSIPVIDYKTSPFYNPSTKQIVIGPNTINYSVSFNNGSGLMSKELSASFSNIVINVKPRCGTGDGYLGIETERCMPYNRTLACESHLGESSATCCCDCPCPAGKYCDIDANGGYGRCRSVGEISLVIDKFDPRPIECEIGWEEEDCVFYKQLDVELHVEPEANYSLTSASYEIDGEKYEMWSCIIATDNPPWNKYECSIIPENIESDTTISPGTIDENVKFSLSIESTGLLHTTVTDGDKFEILKIKSDALLAKEAELANLDADMNALKRTRNMVYAVLIILAAFCLFCTCLPLCGGSPCCPWLSCADCWTYYGCLASYLILKVLIPTLNEMDMIKAQIEALNSARTPGSLSQTELTMKHGVWKVLGYVALAVCIAGMLGAFNKAEKAVEAAAEVPKVTAEIAAGAGASRSGAGLGNAAVLPTSSGFKNMINFIPYYFMFAGNGGDNGLGGFGNGDGEKEPKCGDLKKEGSGCRCCYPEDGSATQTDTQCTGKRVKDKCGAFGEKDKGRCIKGIYCPAER